MIAAWGPVDALLSRLVPAPSRESLLGDLIEQGLEPGWRRTRAILGVAAFFHAEPYREADGRAAALWTLAAGVGLLWAVPAAAGQGVPVEGLYREPLGTVIELLWSTSHLTAAVAAGLVVGHAAWLPPWAAASRSHAALLLSALAAVLSPSVWGGALAAGLHWAAVWLGAAARNADEPPGAALA